MNLTFELRIYKKSAVHRAPKLAAVVLLPGRTELGRREGTEPLYTCTWQDARNCWRAVIGGHGLIVSTFNQGVQALAATQSPLATLVNQQLPVLQQSLSDALGLTKILQAPFQAKLTMPADSDPTNALNALASQLAAAGLTVQTNYTTPTGTNDPLVISYNNSWTPSASFSVGGNADFSGLQYLTGANFTGSLQAAQPTVNLNLTFGVELLAARSA